MKKILYIVGLATMILINASAVSASNDIYYTNQNEIEMTENEYNNLLNLGFTDYQIKWMDNQTFLDNKDIQATIVSEEKKIIKTTTVIRNGIKRSINTILTEEELENELMRSQQPPSNTNSYGSFYDGMTYDSVKEMDIRIAMYEDEGQEYARFKLDIYWDIMPSYRYYDIEGIYFNGSLVNICTPLIHRQDYITGSNNHGYIDDDYYVKSNTNSGSVMFELPSGSLNDLRSYLYFGVQKNQNVGTITELTALGDYAHAGNSVSPTDVYNHYSMTSIGIIFDNYYNGYYEDMLEASALFVGQW